MYGSFLAEVLKLRKRPAVWILAGIWLGVVVLFMYIVPALLFSAVAANAPPGAAEASVGEQFTTLTLENLVAYLLQFLFSGLGTAVGLILGSLAAGSEYGWGTYRVALSQLPGRLGVLSGKLLALAALLLVFVLAAFLCAILSSLVVALFAGASLAPPPLPDFLGGIGAATLLLVVWAALGFLLATLTRSTALAVGLGLIYAFFVEPVLTGLAALSQGLQTVVGLLPGVNASALTLAFAGGPPGLGGPVPGPGQAVLVLLVYVAVFVLVATLVFLRRDVI